MKQQGVIYDAAWGRESSKAQRVFRYLGSGLIVAGLAGLIFTFAPVISSETRYQWYKIFANPQEEQRKIAQQAIEAARAEEELGRLKVRKLAREFGVPNTHFSIYIPKINAKAPISENIDTTKQAIYMSALSRGVAHAAGSVFPGMEGATFLFAHSTDAPWNVAQYNAVFYLLRELENGDQVYVFFLDKVYKYKVSQKRVVEPEDVSWLTGAREGSERLILQTCWPPGTVLKRLILVAEPVD